jgi:glycosyltransferase involved in cell wall biosynthesis
MKNGLFIICDANYNLTNAESNGVAKKIFAQLSVFNDGDTMRCKIVNLYHKRKYDLRLFITYLLFDIYKNIPIDLNDLDFIYMRRIVPLHFGIIKLFQKIKKKNQYCKIVYELPTYPYDEEHKTIRSKVGLYIDKLFRKNLKKYVDRIATVSNDSIIFGIPTIKIINGINCASIPIKKPLQNGRNIHLIAVAQFTRWHGYDRLIEGLNNYYKKNQEQMVYIHFVGDGPSLPCYKHLVKQYNLSAYVFFYGLLYGEELANVFNKTNIAICSLGGQRKGLCLSSELKSREYLVRGLPMIVSTKIDIIPPNFKYCLYVPEDESAINIEHIVVFYNKLLIDRSVHEMTSEIRKFAEENCEMAKTMLPVLNYINSDLI